MQCKKQRPGDARRRDKQWGLAILTMGIGVLISALLYLVIDAGQPLVPGEGREVRAEAEVKPAHSSR